MDLIILKGGEQIGPLNILEVADMFERGEISLDDNVVVPPNTQPQTLEQLIKQQSPIIQDAFGIKSDEMERLERGIAVEKALKSTGQFKVLNDTAQEHLKNFGYKKHSSWEKEDLRAIDVARDLSEKNERGEILFLIFSTEDKYDFYVATDSDANAAQKKSSCFVATAAYGSPLAPEVIFLSRFRDDFLLKSKLGGLFVGFYYQVSPSLASQIARVEFLRAITRTIFLAPIIRLLKFWIFKK